MMSEVQKQPEMMREIKPEEVEFLNLVDALEEYYKTLDPPPPAHNAMSSEKEQMEKAFFTIRNLIIVRAILRPWVEVPMTGNKTIQGKDIKHLSK